MQESVDHTSLENQINLGADENTESNERGQYSQMIEDQQVYHTEESHKSNYQDDQSYRYPPRQDQHDIKIEEEQEDLPTPNIGQSQKRKRGRPRKHPIIFESSSQVEKIEESNASHEFSQNKKSQKIFRLSKSNIKLLKKQSDARQNIQMKEEGFSQQSSSDEQAAQQQERFVPKKKKIFKTINTRKLFNKEAKIIFTNQSRSYNQKTLAQGQKAKSEANSSKSYCTYGYLIDSDAEISQQQSNVYTSSNISQKFTASYYEQLKQKSMKKENLSEINVKDNYSETQITLEGKRPYLRRENFLQTYKSFIKYLVKLLDFNFLPLNNMEQSQVSDFAASKKFQANFISQLILKKFMEEEGLKTEHQVYNFMLEKSFNTPSLKECAEKLFHRYINDEDVVAQLKREFSYKKGKINYFDPDFEGSIKAQIDRQGIVFYCDFECFKDKLYLRVMMVMYKKLIRLVFMLDYVLKRVFGDCGRRFTYYVNFFFKYTYKLTTYEIKSPATFKLLEDFFLTVYYIKDINIKNFEIKEEM